MTEFQMVAGFEDVWRPAARPRRVRPEGVLTPGGRGSQARARLTRLVARAPEVMVKVTGRTRDAGGLLAHLDYISRRGGLEAEDRHGIALTDRQDIRDLADDWSQAAARDERRRVGSPVSLSIVLSMPSATDAIAMRDAAGSFARETFGEGFDYVFVLHTDTPHPHVHLAVRAFGDDGGRLNPKKADLAAWREAFAQALRERGVAAEATPRRARGVTRKAERGPVRRLRERTEAGSGARGRVATAALREAARSAVGTPAAAPAWEDKLVARQGRVRALYLAQARLLQASAAPGDRALGQAVERFVREMPRPDSQRLALARAVRDQIRAEAGPDRQGPERGRSRTR